MDFATSSVYMLMYPYEWKYVYTDIYVHILFSFKLSNENEDCILLMLRWAMPISTYCNTGYPAAS